MPVDIIVTIIVSCIGSSALFGFIQFIITRRDKKKGDLAGVKESVEDLKNTNKKFQESFEQIHLDTCRLQLMTLIHMAPQNVASILELGKHYFDDLDGDSYLSYLFSQWLRDSKLEKFIPDWFQSHYKEERDELIRHHKDDEDGEVE